MTHVLIVDDKEENLYYLKALLQGHGCTVDAAHDGAEALIMAFRTPPAMVISDLLMPVMDGYTLLSHWKANGRLQHIPFIVYTATYTQPQDEQLALSLGADAFILKPSEPEDFMEKFYEVQKKAAANAPMQLSYPIADEKAILRLYNESLIRKLEEKSLQLEATNRALQLDISQRKKLEAEREKNRQALRASDDRYRDLVENAIDIIYTFDLDGNYTSVNKAGETILGYSNAESLSRNMTQSIAPESLAKAREMMAAQIAGKNITAMELETIAKDGRRVTLEVNTKAIMENGKAVGIQGIARDITDRKRAEIRFRRLVESNAQGVFFWNTKGQITGGNDAFLDLAGYTRLDLDSGLINWVAMTPPEFAYLDAQALEQLADHGTCATYQKEWLRKDGSRVPILLGAAMFDDNPDDGVCFVLDVTQSKRAEEALRASDEKFKQLADNITDAFWIRSRDMSEVHYISPAYEKIWGRTVESDYANPEAWLDFVVPEDREAVRYAYLTLMEDTSNIEIEYRMMRPDGDIRWLRARGFQVRDADGTIVSLAGIITDLTDQKRLEEQVRQSQKMEAVGVLAGGIAHDFNNLLTAINGYSTLALRKMTGDDPLRQFIEEIHRAGERAAGLTRQLLAFSRNQILKPIVININSVIQNLEEMLKRIMRENVRFDTVLAGDLGNISADPGQIEQVIVNLAVNAGDAMPNGGTLTIKTDNIYLDSDSNLHPDFSPGHYIRLTVSDTGMGIDEATRKRIFEPFFTTKDVGKGTGLGLSTVYGIVKQSGGNIDVESISEQGSTFVVYFPCVVEKVQTVAAPSCSAEKVPATETILLVEDELLVRNLIREVLTGEGYTVLEAANGEAALDICRNYPDDIQLLLSDVVMPGMGGDELKNEVLKLRPDIKVVFISGYVRDLLSKNFAFDAGLVFVEKPCEPEVLINTIREVLLPSFAKIPQVDTSGAIPSV